MDNWVCACVCVQDCVHVYVCVCVILLPMVRNTGCPSFLGDAVCWPLLLIMWGGHNNYDNVCEVVTDNYKPPGMNLYGAVAYEILYENTAMILWAVHMWSGIVIRHQTMIAELLTFSWLVRSLARPPHALSMYFNTCTIAAYVLPNNRYSQFNIILVMCLSTNGEQA